MSRMCNIPETKTNSKRKRSGLYKKQDQTTSLKKNKTETRKQRPSKDRRSLKPDVRQTGIQMEYIHRQRWAGRSLIKTQQRKQVLLPWFSAENLHRRDRKDKTRTWRAVRETPRGNDLIGADSCTLNTMVQEMQPEISCLRIYTIKPWNDFYWKQQNKGLYAS